MKEPLIGKTLSELELLCEREGFAKYVSRQLASWLYDKRVQDIDGMSNISKAAREILKEKYCVGIIAPEQVITSVDGTKKYAFPTDSAPLLENGRHRLIEAVMIPDEDRATLCVSSQVGCKMGCKFCMTGRQHFHGNLTAAEILSQFLSIDESAVLTNAVFMGMGEPLDNWPEVSKAIEILTADWGFGWSPKRITLSTIGVLPNLKQFLDNTKCHLAISIHNPFPAERLELMPVQKKYDITEVVALLKQYDFSGQRRVSFEYTMFSGVNDTKRHADGLVHLLRGLECRVNLIRFHKIPDSPLETSPDEIIELFRARLNAAGLLTTVRASRGEDILAACGMLAGKNLEN
ncbi:MAG: 23S rRNA (adenine(2503)-C(2))-methyltransferase RlmN [Bacteroidales bacterium]|nr:23S rRNA (adenine(2503)-C(2))-methyltransferase RlmN [Bacteroidales bacterium]